jgi:hypothetical protein
MRRTKLRAMRDMNDEDHDVSDFAKLFTDNEHPWNIRPNFPQARSSTGYQQWRRWCDNGLDYFSPLPKYPTTVDDKVGDICMDDLLGTEKECSVEKSTQETIGINSYKEALTSRHSDKWKEAMAKEIEEIGCWRLVRQSDLRV